MTLSTNHKSSERPDSTNSLGVFPKHIFLSYVDENGDYELRWYGGQYIECDYGSHIRGSREFSSQETIEAFDYTNIEVSMQNFAARCQEYVQQRSRSALAHSNRTDEGAVKAKSALRA